MKKRQAGDKQVEALKAQLARALADYDNLTKRIEREQDTFEVLARARLLSRLMPVFDMLEQVQIHLKDAGLAIALGELKDKLKEEGFEPIEPAVGDRFDEVQHEAVDATEAEGRKDGEILSVMLAGWKLAGGIVLRPAKVVVAKRVEKTENKQV